MAYDLDPVEPNLDGARVGSFDTAWLLDQVGEALNATHAHATSIVGGLAWHDGRFTHEGVIRTLGRLRLPTTSDAHATITIGYSASVAAGGGGKITFDTGPDEDSVVVGGDVSGELTLDLPSNAEVFDLAIRLESAGGGHAAQLDAMHFRIDVLTAVDPGRVDSHGVDNLDLTPGPSVVDDEPYPASSAYELAEGARTLLDRVRLVDAYTSVDLVGGATESPPVDVRVPFDLISGAGRNARTMVVNLYIAGGDEDETHLFVIQAPGLDEPVRIPVQVDAEAAAAWYTASAVLPEGPEVADFVVLLDTTRDGAAWTAWTV